MTPAEPVYFVHISDTHFGPTPGYSRHGHVAMACAEELVTIINRLPVRPDFVVHTGDVVTNPDPAGYLLAAQTFARLNVPIYYVNGNHDRAVDLHHFLPMGPKTDLLDSRECLVYRFDVKGCRFLVLDGRGPDEIDPQGILTDEQLALVRQEAEGDGPRLCVFIHYPALPLNAPWMDANMRLINWAAFHQALRPAGARLRGVFHGHVHQNMQTVRDGILYVAVASTFSQFAAWPSDVQVRMDPDHLPGYNFVHLLPEQTIIHQHTFPRPG